MRLLLKVLLGTLTLFLSFLYSSGVHTSGVYMLARQLYSLNKVLETSATDLYGNYFTIPQSTLEFTLSSTKSQGDAGVTSISEILEKPGFIAYESDEYQDYLSVGIFKIRRSLQISENEIYAIKQI